MSSFWAGFVVGEAAVVAVGCLMWQLRGDFMWLWGKLRRKP